MSNPSRAKGYLFTRPIGGQVIPHRVQNLVIRTYAQASNLLLLFGVVEYNLPDCYMILKAALNELEAGDALIFYGTHQMPPARDDRLRLYRQILERGATLHFALEELVVASAADIETMETVFQLRAITSSPLTPGLRCAG